MLTPTNKQELQGLLGFVNYFSKSIPYLSQIPTPVQSLLEKNSYWIWNPEHKKAMDKTLSLPIFTIF